MMELGCRIFGNMKKLTFVIIALMVQDVFGQAPFNFPDNIGSGNCLQFDGVDDFVDVPFDASLHPTDITISMWVQVSGTPATRTWFFTNSGAGANPPLDPYRIALETGRQIRVQFEGDNGTSFIVMTSSSTLNLNEWYHISATYDAASNNAFLYINGIQEASNNTAMTLDANNLGLKIGATQDDNGNAVGPFFQGAIDEISIWSRALPQAEVRDRMCQSLTGGEMGLVGYWNMNDALNIADTNVDDLTSNNNDGTRQ